MVERVEGEMHQEYLEDGVYASFDGFQIWLRADRDGMEHSIALEPVTMGKLVAYASRVFGGPIAKNLNLAIMYGTGKPTPEPEDLTARLARLKDFEP